MPSPKLRLPIEIGKRYRRRDGRIEVARVGPAANTAVLGERASLDSVFVDSGRNSSVGNDYDQDAVEGPLDEAIDTRTVAGGGTRMLRIGGKYRPRTPGSGPGNTVEVEILVINYKTDAATGRCYPRDPEELPHDHTEWGVGGKNMYGMFDMDLVEEIDPPGEKSREEIEADLARMEALARADAERDEARRIAAAPIERDEELAERTRERATAEWTTRGSAALAWGYCPPHWKPTTGGRK